MENLAEETPLMTLAEAHRIPCYTANDLQAESYYPIHYQTSTT